jgi:DNA invertase Pin-like site-specific DNA recombinase
MDAENSYRRLAMGYARVSTEQQESHGDLDRQFEKIRRAARELGLQLKQIFADEASGAAPVASEKRAELTDALRTAKREGAVLIVPEISRLARLPVQLHEVFRIAEKLGVSIISAVPGEIVDGVPQESAISRAERELLVLRESTKTALGRMKETGRQLGHSETLVEGRKTSIKLRKRNADAKVDEVADYLTRYPDHASWLHEDLAQRLNDAGIYSGRGILWTKNGVRQARKKARVVLDARARFDAAPDDFEHFRTVEPPADGAVAGEVAVLDVDLVPEEAALDAIEKDFLGLVLAADKNRRVKNPDHISDEELNQILNEIGRLGEQ